MFRRSGFSVELSLTTLTGHNCNRTVIVTAVCLVECGTEFSCVVGDGSKDVFQLSFGINVICKAQLLYQVIKDILWMETGEK